VTGPWAKGKILVITREFSSFPVTYSVKIINNSITVHRLGSGVCRGSNTPTIYEWDIDMYIPSRKI